MRILLLNKFSRVTGGADRHCLDLAVALNRAGHDVMWLSTMGGESEIPGAFVAPITTHAQREQHSWSERGAIALRALWNRSAAAAIERLIEDFSPDVVHAHKLYPQLSVAPLMVAERKGIPIVQTVHDYEFISANPTDATGGRVDKTESRLQYRALNSVLFGVKRRFHVPAVDEWVAVSRSVSSRYSAAGIECTVLPNFTPHLVASPRGHSERHGITYVGRLTSEKGVRDLVEVARRLPRVQVRLAGGGPLENELRAATREVSNLKLLGTLPASRVRQLLAESLICVMPSRWEEPGALVCLESMACGTPVVAYEVGGLVEYVGDARAGVTVEKDPIALANACAELLGDRAKWEALSEHALRAAKTTHAPETYVASITNVYQRAVAGNARDGGRVHTTKPGTPW
jgi:glycosyltransferase involved in cell wall biosynthesis